MTGYQRLPMMVADKDIYHLTTLWGRRREWPDALAIRWIALVARLQGLHPAFADWCHWEDGQGSIPFDPRPEVQAARLLTRTDRHISGQLLPGSRIYNITDTDDLSRRFRIELSGGHDSIWSSTNYTIFGSNFHAVPNPELVTYRIFRGAMLAMAETFEVTQSIAWTSDLRGLWADARGVGKTLDLAWITYIAPRFAHLVTPPSGVVVEHRPDGGLLMAATDETFSAGNPAHIAGARAILAALGAYNAVPWTLETGK